jgi:uncharacterized cupredoxin-like copper-binding protein
MLSIARCFSVAALALSVVAIADDSKPQPERKILERHDQSSVPGKEVVIGTATLPAGRYDFFCPVDGHKQAGMNGRLIVK